LINLHGIPKPTYRAYQLLHETGNESLTVTGPPPPPPIGGTCEEPQDGIDVWGGDVGTLVEGVGSSAECCQLCVDFAPPKYLHECMTYTWWKNEKRCGLKDWSKRVNSTANPNRISANVTRPPKKPATPIDLCSANTGVMAVRNGSEFLDILMWNHAAQVDPICDCMVDVLLPQTVSAAALSASTVRRIDEEHANPLATWLKMGAPDYTTEAQNQEILAASELQTENLAAVGSIVAGGFNMLVPAHGVAVVRILAN